MGKRKSRRVIKASLQKRSEKKRAEPGLQTQLRRIEALHEIEIAVTSSLDLRSILDVAVEKIRRLLPYANGFIRLLNSDTGILEPVSWWNLDIDEWRKLPWMRSGASTAFETGQPLIVRNVLKDPKSRYPELTIKLGVTSYLGISLVAKGNKLGAISFNATEPHEFTNDEVHFLTTLAGQIAMAIYNSQLFAKISQLAMQLAVTNERLAQAEEKYRGIFENTHDGIFQSTPDGRILTANTALAQILGYDSPEELTTAITDVANQLYVQPQRRREFQQRMETYGFVSRLEVEVRRKNGSPIWVSVKARAVRDDKGKLLYYEGTVANIDERRRARMALDNHAKNLRILSLRRLEDQEGERRRIARELHDEIGQALTALKINMQANLQGFQDLPAAGVMKSRITDSIAIVDGLLQQVCDLALAVRPAILDHLGLVPALRSHIEHQVRRAGLDVRLVIDPPDFRAHPRIETECFRIVQESLTNVIRHARAKRVSVELRQLDSTLHVLIRDDGAGFDVAAARAVGEGKTLGLLGMEERALLVGGQITVESEPGKGTAVRVSLPLDPNPASPELRG